MVEVGAPLFYCPELAQSGSPLALSPEEARHAAAQRLRVGDAVALFDGRGHGARARVATVGARGRGIEIEIGERFNAPAPLPPRALYCALPKGERLATLLDMATQLGMTRFVPLLCARSVVQPGAGWQARAQRICIEACKQSRRLILPDLGEPTPLAAALAAARETTPCVWFAHPGGSARPNAGGVPSSGVAMFIGPEGGFTDEEVAQAEHGGITRVDLGSQLLRIETAAVALLAIAGTSPFASPRPHPNPPPLR